MLRELGVLIVAIMVVGRSGSAYTAELGSMKRREEIDALSTMGLDPVEVLILPRVIALICALPILSFTGSMAALYCGGLVAQFHGGMSPAIYLARLHEAISHSPEARQRAHCGHSGSQRKDLSTDRFPLTTEAALRNRNSSFVIDGPSRATRHRLHFGFQRTAQPEA